MCYLLAAFCHSLLLLGNGGWLIGCYLSSSALSSPSRCRQLESDRLQTGSSCHLHATGAHMFVVSSSYPATLSGNFSQKFHMLLLLLDCFSTITVRFSFLSHLPHSFFYSKHCKVLVSISVCLCVYFFC